jgi:hypothetical protein
MATWPFHVNRPCHSSRQYNQTGPVAARHNVTVGIPQEKLHWKDHTCEGDNVACHCCQVTDWDWTLASLENQPVNVMG